MSSKSVQKKLLKKSIEQRTALKSGSKGKSSAKSVIPIAPAEEDSSSDEDDDEEVASASDDDEEMMTFDDDDEDDDDDDDDEEEDGETDEEEGDDQDEEEDEDEEDVDEKGWNRMMELLGDVDPTELGLELDEEDEEEEAEGRQEDEDEDEQDELEGEEDDSEEDEQMLYEDLEAEADTADLVPVARNTVNNEVALERVLDTFKSSATFFDTLSLTNPNSLTDVDADNDLERELAFYKQSLWAAQKSEKLFKEADLPFFRPADYFAEMIKSDAHMASLRQKLLDEQAGMKASEDARKLRDAKKFGKKVQVERLKEREKEKKEVGKRLESLKKKRKGGEGFATSEDFDIALEDAIAGPSKKRKVVESERGRGGRGGSRGISRRGRDSKFGNPTSSRRPKENNFKTDGDGGERGPRGGRGGSRGGSRGGRGGARGGSRGGAKRLGKSRRS